MSQEEDKNVIESLMRHGDNEKTAKEKLKKVKKIIKRADGMAELETIQSIFRRKSDKRTAEHLMNQLTEKLNKSRKRARSSQEDGYSSSSEDWSTLPHATLTDNISSVFKKIRKGGKTRKNRSRRNRNRKH